MTIAEQIIALVAALARRNGKLAGREAYSYEVSRRRIIIHLREIPAVLVDPPREPAAENGQHENRHA